MFTKLPVQPKIGFRISHTSIRSKSSQTHQDVLTRVVKNLFPSTEMVINDRRTHGLVGDYNVGLELDIYLPHLNLAFEFQDKYHFVDTLYGSKSAEEMEKRDVQKRVAASEKGITIILVPYWWDGNPSSLIATIRKERSDLLCSHNELAEPIPERPPTEMKLDRRGIEGFGKLTSATFYNDKADPTNWMMFEKYDGIRGFWNPQEKQVRSRFGNVLSLPNEIIEQISDITVHIDGELWFGRGSIREALKISSRADPRSIDWKKLKFMAFDLPLEKDKTYKERYEMLQKLIPPDHPIVSVAQCTICTGRDHFEVSSKQVIEEGGEGVILRNPSSIYKHGVTKDFLKFKVFRDAEARIVSQSDESPNMWICELPSGIRFQSKVSPELQSDELKEGDIVSFKYTRYKYIYSDDNNLIQIPVSPVLYRIRTDLSWDDVIDQSVTATRKVKTISNKLTTRDDTTKRDKGYWNNIDNRRKFMIEFANKKGFDPMNVDSWYSIKKDDIISEDGGGSMLKHHGGSIRQALLEAFPNLPWDVDRLRKRSSKLPNTSERREILIDYANKKGFDPYKKENWYRITSNDITQFAGNNILSHFHGSVPKLLLDTFPELEWDINEFSKKTVDPKLIKDFFINFAELKGFDPVSTDHWYDITNDDIINQGGSFILSHYNGSLRNALVESFPNLEWNDLKFRKWNFWKSKENIKNFLMHFASQRNFDPQLPENWELVKKQDILSEKGGASLLKYYGSLRNALSEVFPDISWDNKKLQKKDSGYWLNVNNCKEFFLSFAKSRNFDPNSVDNWYKITKEDVVLAGGSGVINRFGSLKNALITLFPNLEWDESKLNKYNYWSTVENVRNFFENFASENGFHATDLSKWESISKNDILTKEGGGSMLFRYGGSVKKALQASFPELQWDSVK